MPAYNASATIAAAISSVLAQTRDDFELVVVNDGSTDDTAAVVRSFESDGRIKLFEQENRGLATARNRAIAEGSGDLVAFLDSDDLWLPSYLEAMAAALEGAPDAGFAYTDAWVYDDASRRIAKTTAMHYQHPPVEPPADPAELLRLLVQNNFIFTSVTVRRSVLDRVGRYDENLRAAEDYELWLRIAAHGFRAVRPPGVLAVYRKRAGSLSSDPLLMARSESEVFRLVSEEYSVPADIREAAAAKRRVRERQIAALTGSWAVGALALRARAALVRLKLVALAPRAWYRTVPEPLAPLLTNPPSSSDSTRPP